MSTDLNIRIKAKLDTGVKRAIAGITADVKKSEKDRAKAAAKAEADKVKAAADAEKARQALNVRSVSNFRKAEMAKKVEAVTRSREILEDFKKAEKKKRDELAKTLRETQLSERRREQLIKRTEREIARERGRARADAREMLSGGAGEAARGRRRRIAGAVGGALVGAAAGALSVSQRAQGALGIRSQEEIIAESINSRQDFIRTSVQGGMSQQQQDDALRQAVEVSRSSGIGTGEILAGINTSQELFANLDRLLPNLGFLADVTRATGGEFQTVVAASGELERQFGLQGDELQEAIAILARGAEEGSLSLRDFAESQAEGFSGFTQARGISGVQGVRELSAVAQALRAGGLGANQVRTRQQALISSLSDSNVQQRLRRAGVNVLNDDGAVRNIGDIVNEVRNARRLQGRDGNLSSTKLRTAFGNQEAMQALAVLASQESAAAAGQEGALSLSDRQNVSADAGRATIAATLERLNADASGRAVSMRANREASVFADSERLINAFADVAGPLTELQDEFPVLTQAVQALTTVMGGAGAGGLGGGLLAGLTGGGAGAAGAGGVGTLAAAGGVGAVGAAVAIPAALAAGGMMVPSSEDDSMFDFWRNAFSSGSLTQAASGGTMPQAGKVDEANTRATEANTRAMEAAAREMASAAREVAAAARGGGDTGAETPIQ